ncbi:methylmalonyl-CoA epimerase [Halorubrum vacuolatum]|nr:methylmalonyl-CoA epimerase [Halorubrum vacuolatum]
MRFDHVGIATRDIGTIGVLFEDLLHAPVVHEERFEDLRIVFLKLEGGGYFELLEPVAEGTIGRYLDRHGPGIHHVALETADIDGALSRARSLGIDLVDEEPRAGAWGHDVAFLHPASTGGVLLEFVEH